jgi:hypothetical protein
MITSSCITMLACNNQQKTDADTKAASTTTDSSTTKPQSEFADAKYTEMGKQMLAQFESDDVDAWVNNFADNAVYLWSAGDSLVGKKAIADYWKARRANVIDSIKFTNDIWLPLKVNTPQKGPDIAGVWLLSWYQVNVKYKNGKRLGFWIHNDLHYNSDDKIDRQIQYIDRAPINAALGVR